MQIHLPNPLLATLLLLLAPLAHAQVAAGGGAPVAVVQATQDKTIRDSPHIFTVNGVTSVTRTMFTQTFASTALGTWDLGPTPQVGTIGLGNIEGVVGKVKGASSSKR